MDENEGDPCQDILSFPFVSPQLKTFQRRKIVSISVNVMTHGGWARPLELEPHPATCLSGGQTTNRGCQGLYTFLLKNSNTVVLNSNPVLNPMLEADCLVGLGVIMIRTEPEPDTI